MRIPGILAYVYTASGGFGTYYRGYFTSGGIVSNEPVRFYLRLDFSNETLVTTDCDFGYYTGTRYTGTESSTKGYMREGTSGSYQIFHAMNFTTEINNVLTVGLKDTRSSPGAVKSTTKGYFCGGYLTTEIESLVFSTETIEDPTAVLSQARSSLVGVEETTKGFLAGGSPSTGYSNRIDRLTYSTESCTNIAATLVVARSALGGVESTTRGYFCGGIGAINEIDGVRFDTEAGINPTATLTVGRYSLNGISANTNGYLGGSHDTTAIDKLVYSTETCSAISASFPAVRDLYAGLSSQIQTLNFDLRSSFTDRGYFLGVFTEAVSFSNDTFHTVSVTYMTYSSTFTDGVNSATNGYVSNRQTMHKLNFSSELYSPISFTVVNRYQKTGVNSATRGYFGGGYTGSANTNEIDGIQFSDETYINPTAGLVTARRSLAGVNSSTKGFFAGGIVVSQTNYIDSIVFSTETTSGVTATLAVARAELAGVNSSTHGYFAGGSGTSEIDGIVFSTEASHNPTATLVTARNNLAGVNSSSNGYFAGGGGSRQAEKFVFSNESISNLGTALYFGRDTYSGIQSGGYL